MAFSRDRPLRIKATGRQVFMVWQEWEKGPARGTFWVDLHEGSGRRGFRYKDDGMPFDEGCPWGQLENFHVDDDPFESVDVVTPKDAYNPATLAAKRERERAAMLDAMGDNDAWGMF